MATKTPKREITVQETRFYNSRKRLTMDSLLSSALPDVLPRSRRRPSMTSSVVEMKRTKEDRQTYHELGLYFTVRPNEGAFAGESVARGGRGDLPIRQTSELGPSGAGNRQSGIVRDRPATRRSGQDWRGSKGVGRARLSWHSREAAVSLASNLASSKERISRM